MAAPDIVYMGFVVLLAENILTPSSFSCHNISGTPVELKEMLKAYGIPSFLIPITDDGEVIKEHANLKWTQYRLEEQRQRLSSSSIQNLKQTGDMELSENPRINLDHQQGQNAQFAPSNIMPTNTFDIFWPTNNTHPAANTSWHQSMDESLSSAPNHSASSTASPRTESLPSPSSLLHNSSPAAAAAASGWIATPSNNDVLLGRGRLCQRHAVRISLLCFNFNGTAVRCKSSNTTHPIVISFHPSYFQMQYYYRETSNFEPSLKIAIPTTMLRPKRER
jgi:hypothetical protein